MAARRLENIANHALTYPARGPDCGAASDYLLVTLDLVVEVFAELPRCSASSRSLRLSSKRDFHQVQKADLR